VSFLVEIEGAELEFEVYGKDRPATWDDSETYAEMTLVAGELPEGVTLAEAEELAWSVARDESEAAAVDAYLNGRMG
jgi:hypothetical protein